MSNVKNLLSLRRSIKKKKPNFIRQDSKKKKKLGKKWRHARGLHSKIRLGKRGHRKKTEVGYKSPKAVHGLHKSGLKIKHVNSLKDVSNINKDKEGIVIAGGVGIKKKKDLIKKIIETDIKILNIKNPNEYLKKVEEILKRRKEEKGKRKQVKEKKVKEKGKKTEEIKEKKEELAEKIEKEEKEKEKKEKDKLLTKRI